MNPILPHQKKQLVLLSDPASMHRLHDVVVAAAAAAKGDDDHDGRNINFGVGHDNDTGARPSMSSPLHHLYRDDTGNGPYQTSPDHEGRRGGKEGSSSSMKQTKHEPAARAAAATRSNLSVLLDQEDGVDNRASVIERTCQAFGDDDGIDDGVNVGDEPPAKSFVVPLDHLTPLLGTSPEGCHDRHHRRHRHGSTQAEKNALSVMCRHQQHDHGPQQQQHHQEQQDPTSPPRSIPAVGHNPLEHTILPSSSSPAALPIVGEATGKSCCGYPGSQSTMGVKQKRPQGSVNQNVGDSSSPSLSIMMMDCKEKVENGMTERLAAVITTNHERSNVEWKTRRAGFGEVITTELTEIVTDLCVAEWELMKDTTVFCEFGLQDGQEPSTFIPSPSTRKDDGQESGMTGDKPWNSSPPLRESISKTVRTFIMSLPPRYANGVETPSEVLLHMRLMAAVRFNHRIPIVQIADINDDSQWVQSRCQKKETASSSDTGKRIPKLVTICCIDKEGFLPFISSVLDSAGSRILDADMMLSTDGVVLDRLVIDMTDTFRLDEVESQLKEFLSKGGGSNSSSLDQEVSSTPETLHCREENDIVENVPNTIDNQATVLPSPAPPLLILDEPLLPLKRSATLPVSNGMMESKVLEKFNRQAKILNMNDKRISEESQNNVVIETKTSTQSMRQRRPLMNRRSKPIIDDHGGRNEMREQLKSSEVANALQAVPMIPFRQLTLIETLGTGRVSTIYKAVWMKDKENRNSYRSQSDQVVVALKVAMVNQETQDTFNIEELRREADIAARLEHPNICRLIGYAEDGDCFCLAYEYCERGSLMSMLSGPNKSKEIDYIPIALDVCAGMAYLHDRRVIHRDLKLANLLITADGRAKVSDFGMSAILIDGRELTAETGTYRYMSPEILRHSPYSVSADVYSFGVCLWQMITKEVPFAGMTPIQAAFQVANGARPPLTELIPRPMQKIVSSCWQQDPQKRPSFTLLTAELCSLVDTRHEIRRTTRAIPKHVTATVNGNQNMNVNVCALPLVMGAVIPFGDEEDESHDTVGLEI